jgi:hypothetical protein
MCRLQHMVLEQMRKDRKSAPELFAHGKREGPRPQPKPRTKVKHVRMHRTVCLSDQQVCIDCGATSSLRLPTSRRQRMWAMPCVPKKKMARWVEREHVPLPNLEGWQCQICDRRGTEMELANCGETTCRRPPSKVHKHRLGMTDRNAKFGRPVRRLRGKTGPDEVRFE